MAISGVMRPGHVILRVLDMEASLVHYRDRLGLVEVGSDDQGRVYLKAWDEYDCFSVVLRQANEPGMDAMAFKVDTTESLDRLEKEIQDFGCPTKRIDAGELKGCGERVQFEAPTGHIFELFVDKDQSGTAPGSLNPNPWVEGVKGMGATRFDHCLLYGDDLDGSVKLFMDVLGFGISEEVMDGDLMIGAFLSCSNKAHDIAFIRHPEKGKFHHASFYLNSWEELLKAADLISMHDISLDIGPTRHGITRGKTIYFFDPSGNRNEVFSGSYIWYPDKPVIRWTVDELGKAIFYHDRTLNERFLSVVT